MKRLLLILIPVILILVAIVVLKKTPETVSSETLEELKQKYETCRDGGFAGFTECDGCTGQLILIEKDDGVADSMSTYICKGEMLKSTP